MVMLLLPEKQVMENERYNLEKAQEEAAKMRQKIESDRASDYTESERLVEQDLIRLKEDLINILKANSNAIFEDNIPTEILQSAAKEALIYNIKSGFIRTAEDIIEKFSLSRDVIQSSDVQSAAKEQMIFYLKDPYNTDSLGLARVIKNAFSLSEKVIQSPEVQTAAKELLINFLQKNWFELAILLKEEFILPEEVVQSAVKDILVHWLKDRGHVKRTVILINNFNLSEKVIQSPEVQLAAKKNLIHWLKDGHGYIDEAVIIKKKFNLPEEVVQSAVKETVMYRLKDGDFDNAVRIKKAFNLPEEILQSDMQLLRALDTFNGINVTAIFPSYHSPDQMSEDEYQKLFEFTKNELPQWQDEQNISKPFESGSNTFGYRLMLEYLNRQGLTRHDGLHAFNKILELYQASSLKSNQFYGNILKQVKMDDKEYETGTAHHYLNELAQTLNHDFVSVLEKAREYSEINLLKELAQTFDPPKKIFESWNNLKRYADLVQVLEQAEILDELKELKQTGQEKLYQYIEKLAFHPSSKVDMQAVMKFWREPQSFLEGSDSHTPEEVHSRKKPSNYIEIPNLDLTANELRDALVEGDMDTLQVFTPLEIAYKIPIRGKEQTFITKINHKSDPDGVLAGNDTACCMPFGEGKNTVYTFNPNTALFTLQILRGDGTARTIAQSVLTKDRDIGIKIPKVIEQLQQVGEHLAQIVPEGILKKSSAYLACDNVEVARNYQEDEYSKAIELVYQDFFKEYMSRFGHAQGFSTDKVIIGQGYSDTLTHLPEAPNTYAPLAPVGYSDKTGENIYVLDLKPTESGLQKTVTTPEMLPRQDMRISIRGVSYLTFEDTLPVAYLEGKVYADNESLLVNLHNIENGLIAKDINNAAKGRPNMSLKYLNEKGEMKGYIMAYEGVSEEDEPIIYIADLAADKESKTAGGRLMQGFIELYRTSYLEKGNLISIYAQARETTSYQIIHRQLEKIGHDLGINFELEELPTYESGQDTMHPVIIRPVR